jgi:hypothetical protein
MEVCTIFAFFTSILFVVTRVAVLEASLRVGEGTFFIFDELVTTDTMWAFASFILLAYPI